ncbi:adhesion G protein-coupled receptor L3-like isoform X2 [Sycon ciliatum]|uniref:adhesion G protein-coupled receptor L3-like isoform X2 n=1 Tax=Sycon ciliatum TaxID=27933 RepID=UPI0031F61414
MLWNGLILLFAASVLQPGHCIFGGIPAPPATTCSRRIEVVDGIGTFRWPSTRILRVARLPCPNFATASIGYGKAPSATRLCGPTGSWSDSITHVCNTFISAQYCPAENETISAVDVLTWPVTAVYTSVVLDCPVVYYANGSNSSESGAEASRRCVLLSNGTASWSVRAARTCQTQEVLYCKSEREDLGVKGSVRWPRTRQYSGATVDCPSSNSGGLLGLLPDFEAKRRCIRDETGAAVWANSNTDECLPIFATPVCPKVVETIPGIGLLTWLTTDVNDEAEADCPVVHFANGTRLDNTGQKAMRSCIAGDNPGSAKWATSVTDNCTASAQYCPAENETISAVEVLTWPVTAVYTSVVLDCPVVYHANGSNSSESGAEARRRCVLLTNGTASWSVRTARTCQTQEVLYCKSEREDLGVKGSVRWPRTRQFSRATVDCPSSNSGGLLGLLPDFEAKRLCIRDDTGAAVWANSNTDECLPTLGARCPAEVERIGNLGTIQWPESQPLDQPVVVACPGRGNRSVIAYATRTCLFDEDGDATWSPSLTQPCNDLPTCKKEVEEVHGRGRFVWPETAALSLVVLDCPAGGNGSDSSSDGKAVRHCGRDGWISSITETCRLIDTSLDKLDDLKDAFSDISSPEDVEQIAERALELAQSIINETHAEEAVDILQLLVRQTNLTLQATTSILENADTIADQIGSLFSSSDDYRSITARLIQVLDDLLEGVDVELGNPVIAMTRTSALGALCPGDATDNIVMATEMAAGGLLNMTLSGAENTTTGGGNAAASQMERLASFLVPGEAFDFTPRRGFLCPRPVVKFLVQTENSLYLSFENGSVYSTVRNQSLVSSPVITAVVSERDSIQFTSQNGMIALKTDKPSTTHTATCAFWDLNARQWNSSGCTTLSSDEHPFLTECHCNHLTSFAVLMTPKGSVHTGKALSIVTIVGASLSIVCLVLTVLSQILVLWKNPKRRDKSIHVLTLVQALAMILFLVLFLTAVKTSNENACTFVAMLLHYLLLVQFICTLALATSLIQQLVVVFETDNLNKIKLVAYVSIPVFPSLVVGVAAGASNLDIYTSSYSTDGDDQLNGLCWLSTAGMQYALYPIIAIVLLINFVVLGVVSRRLSQRGQATKSSSKGKRTDTPTGVLETLRLAVLFAVMLGAMWIIGGIMVAARYSLALQIIFVVFLPLQGVFQFLLLTVRNKKIRSEWKAVITGTKSTKYQPSAGTTKKHYTRASNVANSPLTTRHRTSSTPLASLQSSAGASTLQPGSTVPRVQFAETSTLGGNLNSLDVSARSSPALVSRTSPAPDAQSSASVDASHESIAADKQQTRHEGDTSDLQHMDTSTHDLDHDTVSSSADRVEDSARESVDETKTTCDHHHP